MNILEQMAKEIESANQTAAAEQTTGAEDVKALIESAVSQARADMQRSVDELKAENEQLSAQLRKILETAPGGSGTTNPTGEGEKENA